MRVLTWNLFHGRARPPAGRPLLNEFARALAGWDWDVALLQEVPPWWPALLGRATGAEPHCVLTSRNFGSRARRAVGSRRPDLVKSAGGGANAMLVRSGPALDARRARIAWWPERRVVHGIRLPTAWVVNLHASVRPPERITRDVERAHRAALAWAGGEPLIVGGDFNLRRPDLPGLAHAAGHWVDHVFARGLELGPAEVLDSGVLSDHSPVVVALTPSSTS